ncbi:penicillin-insensitive murein endopeptidase [Telmatospirillum siberiense]|uniref:Penicillin-insensitive murein endopeptidase n=1 Tax=Telmatospirillum siberiense TaxID=382514 RepID=A0A2N3PXE4_9PROT|nr:penicillin-insensitive murein endopeptidase [Telmatospirillum siberiense]PKU25082.1 penicillin-insensitive murein endopeptidase [Telmatospirillum siberiense]
MIHRRCRRFRLFGLLLVGLAAFAVQTPAAGEGFAASALTSRVRETPFPGSGHSIGSPANGCLSGAEALPLSGRGWETLRPERNRFWGHPSMISFLMEKAGETPSPWRLLVGDIAQPRGGHMASGHGSHQTGIDVDILFRLSDRPLTEEERTTPALDGVLAEDGTFLPGRWGPAQTAILHAFASDPRVERIFVNPAIKQALCDGAGDDRAWLRVLRPWWGHDDHFHVRLHCQPGDAECVPGAPLPPGDGCGGELQSWIISGDWKSRPKPHDPLKVQRPEPPAACRTILGSAD